MRLKGGASSQTVGLLLSADQQTLAVASEAGGVATVALFRAEDLAAMALSSRSSEVTLPAPLQACDFDGSVTCMQWIEGGEAVMVLCQERTAGSQTRVVASLGTLSVTSGAVASTE